MSDLEQVGREARKHYFRLKNWRLVGEEMGIGYAVAYRLATDATYEPKDPHIRFVLGLPALIPSPACPKCGVVHIAKTCPEARNGKPKPPRRVAIRCDNPASAAQTIIKNLEPSKAVTLAAILVAELAYSDVQEVARAIIDRSEIDVISGLVDIFQMQI